MRDGVEPMEACMNAICTKHDHQGADMTYTTYVNGLLCEPEGIK